MRLEIGGAALDLPAALGLALKLPALKILVIRNVKRDGLPPELFSFTRLDVLQLEACNFKVNLSQLRMRIPEVSLLLPP